MTKIESRIVDRNQNHCIVRVDETSSKGVKYTDYVIHELSNDGKRIHIVGRTRHLQTARESIGNGNLYPVAQPPVPKSATAATRRAEMNRQLAHSHEKGGKAK